jgi:thioredoxin 1
MNKAYKPLLVVLVGLIAVVAFVGLRPMFRAKEVVAWRGGLREGANEAATSGKRVLLYFTADWCGPCQEMKHTTWADPRVAAALEAAYVPVKIDFDANPALVATYGVQAIPAFVILDQSGDPARPLTEGAMPAEEFLAWLAKPAPAPATQPATAPSKTKVVDGDVPLKPIPEGEK